MMNDTRLQLTFTHAGMPLTFTGEGANRKGVDAQGRVRVEIDPTYLRPTEVDLLVVDPGKAREKLGCKPMFKFNDLVTKMVDYDLALAAN